MLLLLVVDQILQFEITVFFYLFLTLFEELSLHSFLVLFLDLFAILDLTVI